jgi:hypothetical protein
VEKWINYGLTDKELDVLGNRMDTAHDAFGIKYKYQRFLPGNSGNADVSINQFSVNQYGLSQTFWNFRSRSISIIVNLILNFYDVKKLPPGFSKRTYQIDEKKAIDELFSNNEYAEIKKEIIELANAFRVILDSKNIKDIAKNYRNSLNKNNSSKECPFKWLHKNFLKMFDDSVKSPINLENPKSLEIINLMDAVFREKARSILKGKEFSFSDQSIERFLESVVTNR